YNKLKERENNRESAKKKESQIPFLMVGHNRRFSEPIRIIQDFFHDRTKPLMINYRVNAGPLPQDHWFLDQIHGGRVIGEGGHFIDVMQFITGAQPEKVTAECIRGDSKEIINRDNVTLIIQFNDGSVGMLNYNCTGAPNFPKEYMEVFGEERVAIMDNFKQVKLNYGRKTKSHKFSGDKGHSDEIRSVVEALQTGKLSPISFETLYQTSWVTLAAISAIETGVPQIWNNE
ncbi:MAG: Gfo/Idh/MocA family oxidoreductase, partial [Saprospiraceae bacterium]